MKRLVKSFAFAMNGIRLCFAREPNFRIHAAFTLLVTAGGYLLHISPQEWVCVLLCTGAVVCMEMLNTALEQLCDLVQREKHPVIGTVKDIAAGAVLVSAVVAFTCGIIIFLPKIIRLI